MKRGVRIILGVVVTGVVTVGAAFGQRSVNATHYNTVAANGTLISSATLRLKTTITTGGRTLSYPEGMVFVPAGEFIFGSGADQTTTAIKAFAIGKFEITNAEWLEFVETTRRAAPKYWENGVPAADRMNHPVIWISQEDAAAYCAWLSAKTGCAIALPTEAQWEKAARGPNAYLYPWGNTAGATYSDDRLISRFNFNAVVAASVVSGTQALNYRASTSITINPTSYEPIPANRSLATREVLLISSGGSVSNWENKNAYADFAGSDEGLAVFQGAGFTKAVGSYANGASGYGCQDMAGNVGEWTQTAGVVRGGSWASGVAECRAIARDTGGASSTTGFRIVCNFSTKAGQ